MKNILGIGTPGFNIVKQLGKHRQYKPFVLSKSVEKETKYRCKLPDFDNPEDYENLKFSKIEKWLKTIKNECVVFLSGASISSGVTLRVLEVLHKNEVKISVVYFMPELEVLSEIKFLNHRAVMGILQNYARSGLFEKICLISNIELENIVGSTNVFEYFDQINKVFTNTYFMMDVFKNSKPVTSTFTKPKESCRISTIGISSLDGEDTLFFPFQQEVEVVYYFAINEEKLKNEENLFRKITEKVKSKITKQRKVSFGIYPTQYQEDYIYVEYSTPIIKEINIDIK